MIMSVVTYKISSFRNSALYSTTFHKSKKCLPCPDVKTAYLSKLRTEVVRMPKMLSSVPYWTKPVAVDFMAIIVRGRYLVGLVELANI